MRMLCLLRSVVGDRARLFIDGVALSDALAGHALDCLDGALAVGDALEAQLYPLEPLLAVPSLRPALAPCFKRALAAASPAHAASETSEKLLKLMADLNNDHGVTFIFSTHDPRVMARAKRTIHLVDGRVHQASP